MARDRERKTWREIDRNRSSSFRSPETLERYEQSSKQNAAAKEYRAALEALFQKKPDAADKSEQGVAAVKIPRVVGQSADGEVGPSRRQDLLRRIGNAQGSRAISDAVDAFLAAGHELPEDQELHLQILEHRDEGRVRASLERLEHLLAGQLPKRKPVLVQRLRRLEEVSEERETRDAAAKLRRAVG